MPTLRVNGVTNRPSVSVVVPFRGGRALAARLATALRSLELAPDDELIVADNSDDGVAGDQFADLALIVAATAERSSYHARNAGARVARGEWIVFVDADCEPRAGILDRYFDDPVPDDCGLLAGAIAGAAEQGSLLARYTRDRGFYDSQRGIGATGTLEGGAAPAGNLAVRRLAFEQLGGFAEGIRSAGDFDLCWRAQAAGWRLLRPPGAVVAHRHRDDLPSFLKMIARYGAGASWINGRHPGTVPRWRLVPGLIESARDVGVDVGVNLVRRRPREALYRSIDALGLLAYTVGYRTDNRA
jgi:GT2 family glycosyltransferase